MKKKYLWRKTVSLLLAGAMLPGCVEPLCTQAAGGNAGADLNVLNASKVLELKFGDNLTDSSSNEFSVTSYGKGGQAKDAAHTEGVSIRRFLWMGTCNSGCSIIDFGGLSMPSGIKIASYRKSDNIGYSFFLISQIL